MPDRCAVVACAPAWWLWAYCAGGLVAFVWAVIAVLTGRPRK